MKCIKFETSKGKFLLMEYECNDSFEMRKEAFDYYKLSEITEEQASEIVGIEIEHKSVDMNRLMLDTILKSKGIHLFENPYGEWFSDFKNANEELDWQFAEQKTFYNPYIFKI